MTLNNLDHEQFGAALAYAFRHDLLPPHPNPSALQERFPGLKLLSGHKQFSTEFVGEHPREWLAALDEEIELPPGYSITDVVEWLYTNFGSYRRLPKLLGIPEHMTGENCSPHSAKSGRASII